MLIDDLAVFLNMGTVFEVLLIEVLSSVVKSNLIVGWGFFGALVLCGFVWSCASKT